MTKTRSMSRAPQSAGGQGDTFGVVMKKYLLLVLVFFAVFFFPVSVFAQQGKSLSWSLALQNVRTGDMIAFSAPVQSWTGEQFRFVITPEAGCFAYVIYESPGGNDVTVLYSGPLKSGEPWYSGILQLAPPRGSENFYVVVSLEEQKTLAQRISVFTANPGAVPRRALMNEIFRLRSDVSKFKEAPEKPVLMGGAARGTPDKNQGVEYSGVASYVKTVSIEH